MKHTKLVIGILLVVAALWVIISEQMASASADATINARVITLRSPVAGSFNLRDRELGSEIKMGEALGS
ncbi:HlyD family secretion protein, partial [Thioclava sp. BHET1]